MLLRTIQLGIKSLLLHKLRSLLTMLGVILGVGSVIAMLAIGEGSKREALDRIRQLGAANVIIRSHVHYHEFSGNPTHIAMTTPALQGWGSKYGERQCSGIVDIGLVQFDISEGEYSWKCHLFQPVVDILQR